MSEENNNTGTEQFEDFDTMRDKGWVQKRPSPNENTVFDLAGAQLALRKLEEEETAKHGEPKSKNKFKIAKKGTGYVIMFKTGSALEKDKDSDR